MASARKFAFAAHNTAQETIILQPLLRQEQQGIQLLPPPAAPIMPNMPHILLFLNPLRKIIKRMDKV